MHPSRTEEKGAMQSRTEGLSSKFEVTRIGSETGRTTDFASSTAGPGTGRTSVWGAGARESGSQAHPEWSSSSPIRTEKAY